MDLKLLYPMIIGCGSMVIDGTSMALDDNDNG